MGAIHYTIGRHRRAAAGCELKRRGVEMIDALEGSVFRGERKHGNIIHGHSEKGGVQFRRNRIEGARSIDEVKAHVVAFDN